MKSRESCLMVLKFYTEYGSATAVLCVKFQNHWATGSDGMDEDFVKIEFKMSFGGIAYNATASLSLSLEIHQKLSFIVTSSVWHMSACIYPKHGATCHCDVQICYHKKFAFISRPNKPVRLCRMVCFMSLISTHASLYSCCISLS